MKPMIIMILIILVFSIGSCKIEKPAPEIEPHEPGPVELFCESIIVPMGVLIESETTIDKDLFIEIYKLQSGYGKGFDTFIDFCGKFKPGDLQSDVCKEFVEIIIDGNWREQLEREIASGVITPSLIKTVIFLEKSIQRDYPQLSTKLIDYLFSQMDLIKDPQKRAANVIYEASELHLAGFDGMKKKIIADSDFLLKTMEKSENKISDAEILTAIEHSAVVDLDSALKLRDSIFKKHFLIVEGTAAISAGLMLSDYELGKKYYFDAMNDFNPSEMEDLYTSHKVFDLGFTRLKEKDQKEVFDKFMKIIQSFKRFPILPPAVPGTSVVYEPELPAWYRDALYKFMIENFKPEDRLGKFNDELIKLGQRFPRSHHIEEFIGWEFEWLKQVKDKEARYMLLGMLCVSPNIIFPERVGKSLPQVLKFSEGLNKIIPELELKDAMLEALLVDNPVELKKKLNQEKDFTKNNELILGLFALMRGRHYYFPKSDGGLAEFMQKVLEEWDGGGKVTQLEKESMIVELWAGWDDDKAWDYLEKLNYKEGEYPKYLVNIITATRIYSPGFARRCLEELISKYKEGVFKQSNPQTEMNLVYELARASIPWAEELASVIIEKRGNESPVFSFYSLYRKIISSATLSGAEMKDIERLGLKVQDELRNDLEKYKTMYEEENKESKMGTVPVVK